MKMGLICKRVACLAVTVFLVPPIFAQYAIDWHGIGAGGASAGGEFSLNGSFEAAASTAMAGEGFSIESGFWSARASVTIFDNTTGSENGGIGATITTWLANKFCLGGQPYRLDSVGLLLDTQDSSGQPGPPSAVRLQIFSNDPVTGRPSGSIGPIMNLSGATNPITPLHGKQVVPWVPAAPFNLSADTCYWAVLSIESGGIVGQIVSVTMPSGEAGTFGRSQSADAGKTWQAPDNSSSFKMFIQGSAISIPPQALRITSVEQSGSNLRLSFTSVAGASYFVESSADLVSGSWVTVPGSTISSSGGTAQITLFSPFGQPRQFYRVKQAP